MTVQPLLTVRQTCEVLRISRASLYRVLAAGHLRPIRIGGAVRFRPDDLTAFIQASQAAPDPDAGGPRAGMGWAA